MPRVIGITDKEKGIALGDTIPAIADGIYNTILGITRMVEKYEILPEMVCFDENQEIILVYNNGNIHCNLGKDTLLEEKITRVAAILPKLSDFTGILHLEDYETDITNIIFSKETLYTLKMEIAQIEEETSAKIRKIRRQIHKLKTDLRIRQERERAAQILQQMKVIHKETT